ncbi:MAG: hypothetical protein ACXV3S_13120, partial [Kineosporiaceae bacterium]
LCSDEDDMLDRLGQVDDLDRGACRASAERRFSLPRMAADHERLYRKLLAARAAGTTGGGVTELARTRATPVWARRDRLGAGRRASGGPTAPFTPPAPGDGRVQGA